MANEVKAAFDTAFRDFVTDGVPASGANKVSKGEVRAAGAAVQTGIDSLDGRVSTVEAETDQIPQIAQDAATAKADAAEAKVTAQAGIKVDKEAVRILVTTNTAPSAMTAGAVLDGVTLAAGNRIGRAYNGTVGDASNGVWVVQASGPAMRAADLDTSDEILRSRFSVTAGSHASEAWAVQNTAAITIGTTPIVIAMTTPANPVAAEVIAARGVAPSLGIRVDEIEVNSEVGLSDVIDRLSQTRVPWGGVDEPDYAYAVRDRNGVAPIAIERQSGRVLINGQPYRLLEMSDAELADSDEPNLVFGIRDANGVVGFGVRKDGSQIGQGTAGSAETLDADDASPVAYTKAYDPGTGAKSTIYLVYGDGERRLTDGTYDAFDPVVRKNSYCKFRHQDGTQWRISLDEAV